MAVSINWLTRVITIPFADLAPVGPGLYELDVNALRLELKGIEDGEEGMAFPDTHRHNAPVELSGVTYARTLEVINGYSVTFEYLGTPYTVRCVGANHNLADVKTVNPVSLVVGNAAGLIAVSTTGGPAGPTAAAVAEAVWQRMIEAGLSAEAMLRLLAAQAAGNATGLEGPTTAFKSLDGTKDRIVGTVAGGTRTVTARDGS